MFPAEAYKTSDLTDIDSFELTPQAAPVFRMKIQPDSIVDGDTLRLEIVSPVDWEASLGPARRDTQGRVWIRLLGLDAPETHFPMAPLGLRHQPMPWGLHANDCLMQTLGVTASFDDGGIYSMNDQFNGRTLIAECHGMDRFGRLLAILWREDHDQDFKLFSEPQLPLFPLLPPSVLPSLPPAFCSPLSQALCPPLKFSINFSLLAMGAAYPDLHRDLGNQRIAEFRMACKLAQREGLGIWIHDQSRSGIMLSEASRLAKDILILPRLYRRITAFLQDFRNFSDSAPGPQSDTEHELRMGFKYFLGLNDQAVYLRTEGRSALLSELISWNAESLQLTAAPEDMEWQ